MSCVCYHLSLPALKWQDLANFAIICSFWCIFASKIISVLLCILENVYCVGFCADFVDTACCAILVAIGLTTSILSHTKSWERHCFAERIGNQDTILMNFIFNVNITLEQMPRERFASCQVRKILPMACFFLLKIKFFIYWKHLGCYPTEGMKRTLFFMNSHYLFLHSADQFTLCMRSHSTNRR